MCNEHIFWVVHHPNIFCVLSCQCKSILLHIIVTNGMEYLPQNSLVEVISADCFLEHPIIIMVFLFIIFKNILLKFNLKNVNHKIRTVLPHKFPQKDTKKQCRTQNQGCLTLYGISKNYHGFCVYFKLKACNNNY